MIKLKSYIKLFKNVTYMENPYWKYAKKNFKNKYKNKKNYLYVSSNYNRLKKKYDDTWILNKLIKYLKKNKNLNLFIRKHQQKILVNLRNLIQAIR